MSLTLLASPLSAQTTERASVDSGGNQGNAYSYEPDISADGRYVTFYSDATNLVTGDSNGRPDVFVHDRATGATERVSVDSTGNQENGNSYSPDISADGAYVAFYSYASNLVTGDSNSRPDIFVHDRITGETERVSVDSTGNQANSDSYSPAISAGGSHVAFQSFASNLVSGDSNSKYDVFVHDRTTGATERVSVDSSGNQANDNSDQPAISADGRYVAFSSDASNLVPGDSNSTKDVFVHDRSTGATERVSVDSASNQANRSSIQPTIGAEGRYVAFWSIATNLVTDDINDAPDIFVHDRSTGKTEQVSVDSHGNEAYQSSTQPDISADGRYVAFYSEASSLVTTDSNNWPDIFVHDRITGTTERVSLDSGGTQGDRNSEQPTISADGRYVAFQSDASNLVASDSNNARDVFIRDRGPQIVHSFIGFNSPLENLPFTNSAKAGSAIPIKWQVTDHDGNYVNDLGIVDSLQFAPVACDAQDIDYENSIDALAAGGSGLHYDTVTNEFAFAWKTSKSMAKKCEVFILTLSDGQQQFARFMLK